MTDEKWHQFECQFSAHAVTFQPPKQYTAIALFLGKKPEPAEEERREIVLHKAIHSDCVQGRRK